MFFIIYIAEKINEINLYVTIYIDLNMLSNESNLQNKQSFHFIFM